MSALAVAAIMSLAVLPECGAGQGVLPERMAAVAMVESDGDPLAIGVNGDHPTTLHPASKDAAVATARTLLGQGKSIDLGLAQINSANLAHDGLTIETAFDACASLHAGAAHLAADFEAAWRAAHSRYNTGDFQRGIANGYVHKVELAARRVVAALDVGAAPAATDSQPASAVPVDPNAPPSWDVWSSYDYAASHHPEMQLLARPMTAAGPALSEAAGGGPAAAVPVSGPAVER
jgi:type IV secretion system protein VirB1